MVDQKKGIFELRQAISNDFKKNFDLDYSPEQICINAGPKVDFQSIDQTKLNL